jgi:hypothetical protein
MSQDIAEQNIQMWKVKKLIKSLDAARGYYSPFSFLLTRVLIELLLP